MEKQHHLVELRLRTTHHKVQHVDKHPESVPLDTFALEPGACRNNTCKELSHGAAKAPTQKQWRHWLEVCFCLGLPCTLVIPMLWALQDVDKTDGHQVRHGFDSHNRHSNHEVTAAMHEQLSRPQTSSQKARLSHALDKWRRDARGLEAIGYPTSKVLFLEDVRRRSQSRGARPKSFWVTSCISSVFYSSGWRSSVVRFQC